MGGVPNAPDEPLKDAETNLNRFAMLHGRRANQHGPEARYEAEDDPHAVLFSHPPYHQSTKDALSVRYAIWIPEPHCEGSWACLVHHHSTQHTDRRLVSVHRLVSYASSSFSRSVQYPVHDEQEDF